MLADTLTLPQGRLRPEAQVLGEALVATINTHVQRYPTMSWAEVRAVLGVLERAAGVDTRREALPAPRAQQR